MASEKRGRALGGVVLFAAVLLMIDGLINVFEGLVALTANERVVLTEDKFVIVNITAWGWLLLISGLLMLVIAVGLLSGRTWARFAGIVVVGLHAVTQIGWLGAYPVWSVLMIALDIVVVYALTARWSDVRDRLSGGDQQPWGGEEAIRLSAAEQRTPPLM